MDENIIVNYSTEKENTNFSSTSEENIRYKAWFLLVVYYLLFTIFNIFLFLVIFKTSWPMPKFLQYISNINLYFDNFSLNILFFFTILSGIILYIFPSATLAKQFIKVFAPSGNYFSRLTSAKTITVIIIGILAISFFGMGVSYGMTLWLIPSLMVISVEYLIFYILSSLLIKILSNIKTFVYVISILTGILIVGTAAIFIFFAPLVTCNGGKGGWGTGDYECIATQAKARNDIKLCEKTFPPYNPFDCYRYLAKTERDPSYCEYIWDTHKESKEMCKSMIFGQLSESDRPLKFPEIKYEQSEQTASLGVQVILDEWFYNHGGKYTGFNADSNNTDKINKVLEKVEKKYGYNLDYFLDVRDEAFVLRVKTEDNKKRFYCIDAPSNWSFIDIFGDNFHDDKNCIGEPMDNYIERNIESRRRTMNEPMRRPTPFDEWLNRDLGGAVYK